MIHLKKMAPLGAYVYVILSLIACQEMRTLTSMKRDFPHQIYAQRIKQAGLTDRQLGAAWIQTSQIALDSALTAEIPFAMKGRFRSTEVNAIGWQFSLKRGTSLRIAVDWDSPDSANLFMDVFYREENGNFKRIHSAPEDSLTATFTCKETGNYVLRLQPELLARGTFSLAVQQVTTYGIFPVLGKDSRAIHSFFGAPRDAGRRIHEGIDIFADRGTPVVAPLGGIVRSVRNGGLGGKSIFVTALGQGQTLYFAHLDSQTVARGQTIQPGDMIGFVGNTGNARTTPPHLHLGIYTGFSGAIDPFPFFDNLHDTPSLFDEPLSEMLYWQVNSSQANARSGPNTDFTLKFTLSQRTPIKSLARNQDWHLIETPDGRRAYIYHSLLSPAQSGAYEHTDSLWAFWDPFVLPADSVKIGGETEFQVLGEYKGFYLLREKSNHMWIRAEKGKSHKSTSS